ncbi:MAG: helix-turn-helix domain-containing protein [Lentisphaerae bacterium]|jgi:excisionase family DNA binding protein|nr:helix-turn-helix domain-containing protein [Lentisphaerota bacterium]MBT4815618.1 helix-turn-helix domain-containing protein [Lentisphaerota bacterium]MBT5607459.1 helix-turn-helix domain-containing protein [Lentisphaerota bacterium]MBT7055739.1 helix-turn-helix domain-containing protein [Lentisphaerota bacterium]MBT7843126.1 helix-turn-helix domain-containing protein [Lentisphaerota bacterium]
MSGEKLPIQGPQWFTIKQAAEYLAVGEPTIYRWMRESRMTYRKVGDSTRFLQEDLDALVEVHRSDKDVQQAHDVCPTCHHDVLVPGHTQSTGRIYFRPDKSAFWTLRDANVPTEAKMCARCGAIVTYGDVEKLQALRSVPDGEEEAEVSEESPSDA